MTFSSASSRQLLSSRLGFAYRRAQKELGPEGSQLLAPVAQLLQSLGNELRPSERPAAFDNLERTRPEVTGLAALLQALASPSRPTLPPPAASSATISALRTLQAVRCKRSLRSTKQLVLRKES